MFWGDLDMNIRWKEVLLMFFLGILCPAIVFSGLDARNIIQEGDSGMTTASSATDGEEEEAHISLLQDDGTIVRLPLETYIVGVVLKEMPASFETEALKAQAVVARTYTLRRIQAGGKHAGAAVCTNPSCCQGYCAVSEYTAAGGEEEMVQKVSQSVSDTRSLILTYHGELIEATYFSCSGGRTEDAVAVWGAEIPYLKATQSPGEEQANHYTDTVTFTVGELKAKLGLQLQDGQLLQIGDITYTAGGGVEQIRIGEQTFSGTQIRKLLDLRSTAFIITCTGTTVTITTKGYGHRVGMSQYGADAMAVGGKDFRQILLHYYQGVDIVSVDQID